MSIKLIIFDFDGTLGDTRLNIVTTMQMAIKELQLPERLLSQNLMMVTKGELCKLQIIKDF